MFGLRETALRARETRARIKRRAFEQLGSARYSRPALHDMDSKLDELIGQGAGVYVEAGGADGYTQSNTYYLERFREWLGVLVEPMPEMAAAARRNRPNAQVFQYALVPSDYDAPYVEMEFGDLFTTVRGLHGKDGDWVQDGLVLGWRDHRIENVLARPLSAILDEAKIGRIDLLSLDVEGYEAHALQGLDLSRHAPVWILVEMHDMEVGRAEIGAVLGDHYEEHGLLSSLDVLYRRVDTSLCRSADTSV
jgi:FkbM family methyltransferase